MSLVLSGIEITRLKLLATLREWGLRQGGRESIRELLRGGQWGRQARVVWCQPRCFVSHAQGERRSPQHLFRPRHTLDGAKLRASVRMTRYLESWGAAKPFAHLHHRDSMTTENGKISTTVCLLAPQCPVLGEPSSPKARRWASPAIIALVCMMQVYHLLPGGALTDNHQDMSESRAHSAQGSNLHWFFTVTL